VAEPRWLDEREARIWHAWLAMNRDLQVAMDKQLAEFGLSAAEYAVLVPLSERPDRTLRAGELSRVLGWGRSRLSHQLRRMEGRGLVHRCDLETDGRATMVRITDKACELLAAAAPGHVEAVRRYLIDVVTPAEARAILGLAERVQLAVRSGVPGCAEGG
jgi:DNA-binding MarR family transcriptional regulator